MFLKIFFKNIYNVPAQRTLFENLFLLDSKWTNKLILPTPDNSVCYRQAYPFLLSGPKIGFSPRRGDTFIGAKMWEHSPKNVKISNFGHKFTPQGSLVCTISTKFSDFVRIYRWIIKFLIWLFSGDKQPSYKHFPAVEEFSLTFSIAPSGETTDRINKS